MLEKEKPRHLGEMIWDNFFSIEIVTSWISLRGSGTRAVVIKGTISFRIKVDIILMYMSFLLANFSYWEEDWR